MNKVIVIGVSGPSGSGKTHFVKMLQQTLADVNTAVLCQDDYYKDQSDITLDERELMNYDHPNAIDFDLLALHIINLKQGHAVTRPVYDFTIHTRKKETVPVNHCPVVIVDGILLLSVPEVCDLLDIKVYIETPPDICFIRRLQRDTKERGRSVSSVIHQYLSTVRPMLKEFILPGKKNADFVVPGTEDSSKNFKRVITRIKEQFKR